MKTTETHLEDDEGAATAEYAIATIVAVRWATHWRPTRTAFPNP